jgi:tetratricopeptide (TPR) repeat protein
MEDIMSESNTEMAARFRIFTPEVFIVIGVIALLASGYMGGSLIMPNLIKSRYQEKNCASVLSLDDFYKRIYPSFMSDANSVDLTRECAVYTLAVTRAEQKSWRDSYNAFQVYSQTYPQGLYVTEAFEQSAKALTGLAEAELAEKKYSEAAVNLHLILNNYSNTGSAAQAQELFSQLYASWGGELRQGGDFTGAEQVFNEYQVWAKSNNKSEALSSASHELAQTYLDWALALQAQKKFEEAKTKLDSAMTTDPTPQSASGPAQQATASLPKLYIKWGDDLIEQNDFTGAFERYNTALTLSSGDPSVAKDAIANGYLKWADSLVVGEDFLGALKQADLAQENATTDAMKKTVDDARANIYLAFSKSSGKQAQQAIQDAAKLVCQQHEAPQLPIFGLDKDHKLAGLYGLDQKLPDEVIAKSPGEMHYVVCVNEVVSEVLQYVNFYGYEMFRIKESWNIDLREAATGKLVENHIVEGKEPQPLPTEPGAIVAGGRIQRHLGKPDMNDLSTWLVTAMK